MPRTALTPALTTTVETTVKLQPQARRMIVARCEENAKLSGEIKERKERQQRLKGEVEELFRKEKQGKALLDGCEIDHHKIKLVMGASKKFDQLGFMKRHGLTQADFDEFTAEYDNTPYIRISSPDKEKTL